MIVAYRKWGSEEELEKDPIKALLGYYTLSTGRQKTIRLWTTRREKLCETGKWRGREVRLWKRFGN